MDPRKVFVREATGLVREFSFFDLVAQIAGVLTPVAAVVFAMESIGTFYPGANMLAVIVIAAVVAVLFVFVWCGMAAAIPKTGGDYVWLTRIIPDVPAIGFTYAFGFGIVVLMAWNNAFLIWLYTGSIVSPALAGLGFVYGNPVLVGLGNWMAAGHGLFITGAVICLLSFIILGVGVSMGSRIIRYVFYISMLSVALYAILCFAFNNSDFQMAYDNMFGSGQYANVLRLGEQAGFTGYTFDLFTTLFIGFGLGYFTFHSMFNNPLWAAGEIRKPKAVWEPYLLSICIATVGYLLLTTGFFNLMGADWLGAVGIAYSNPSTSSSLPFSVVPTTIFFLTVMFKDNPVLPILINAGFLLGVADLFLVQYLASTRLVFSLSFDRVFPARLAEVNDRFRTPINALAFAVVLSGVFLSQYAYGPFFNADLPAFATVFFTIAGVSPAMWTLAAVVFALFPWLNRSLYETVMPASFKKKIGLPAVTWLALFLAITQALATYEYVTTNAYPIWAFVAIVVIMIGSFLTYYVIAAVRKRQGIDLAVIFKQIPPE